MYRLALPELTAKYLGEQLALASKVGNYPQVFHAHTSIANHLLGEELDVALVREERLLEAGTHFLKAHEALDSYESRIASGLLSVSRMGELRELRLLGRLNDGRLLLERKDYESALLKFKSVSEGFKDTRNTKGEFEALGCLGQTYESISDYNSAIELCYDVQLAISRKCSDKHLESIALLNLSRAYRSLCDFDLSLETLYLYKDHIANLCVDVNRILEAEELISETLHLKQVVHDIQKLESTLSNNCKNLLKLAKLWKEIGLVDNALGYAMQAAQMALESGDQKRGKIAVKLACTCSLERQRNEDALYYAKKLQEMTLGGDAKERHDAILLLIDVYLSLPTIPLEAVRLLESLPDNHLEVLSRKAIVFKQMGDLDQYERFKDECLSLWTAQRISDHDRAATKLETELAQLDYFINRKASKNVMRLVDGSFSMKSRSMGGTKGLVLGRRSRIEHGESFKRARKKYKRRVIGEEEEEDNDKLYFGNESLYNAICINDKDDTLDDSSMSNDEKPTLSLLPKKRLDMDSARDEYWKANANSTHNTQNTNKAPLCFTISSTSMILRITVAIEDISLVVPVVDDIVDRKTIKWLMAETTERYKSELGREPIIDALFTEEGARLAPRDPIALVLIDGQQVKARVVGFQGKGLATCYVEICRQYNHVPLPFVEERLTDSGIVDFSHCNLDMIHTELVLHAIGAYVKFNNGSVIELKMKNVEIGEAIVPNGLYLGSLLHLDLSFTDATSCSWIATAFPRLQHLCLSFCDKLEDLHILMKELVKLEHPLKILNTSGCCIDACDLEKLFYLPGLCELNISFCLLSSTVAYGLSQLLRKTSTLKVLLLTGCQGGNTAGLKGLICALKVNVTLEELYCDCDAFDAQTLAMLRGCLQGNSRLSLKKLILPSLPGGQS